MKKRLFNDKGKVRKFLNKEGFYVTVFLCITLIATSAVFLTRRNVNDNYANENNINLVEEYNIGEKKNNILDVDNTIQVDKPDETVDVSTQPKDTKKVENTPQIVRDPLKSIINPVQSNEVIMAFSYGTAPVFSQTLNEYRSDHMGVDLKAELGENIVAVLDGKVIKIHDDMKLGQTVVIKHANNIETRYSNLDSSLMVTLNESVKSGQIIGKVGKTASFEIEESSHLHFEVWKDGNCLDPMSYIK